MGEDEYKILVMFYSQPHGIYEGYAHTCDTVSLSGTCYKIKVIDSFVYVNGTKIFKMLRSSELVSVRFGEVTPRGIVFVVLLGDMCFSLLFRDMLSGWKSYSDDLLVCNGGGVSY